MSDAPTTPAGPPATPARRWWRYAGYAAFAAAALLFVRAAAARPPRLTGDIWEFWGIAESFHRHGSPELRDEDLEAVYADAARHGWAKPTATPYAYEKAPDGRWFSVHFWLYGAVGVPAKAYLEATGRDGLAWPWPTNAALLSLAVGFALFASRAPPGDRVALAALAGISPALDYIGWPGPEVFTWAFALVAVVAYRDGRFALAGLAAGVASLQNQPVILFGGFAVLAALAERRWRSAAGAALGTAVGLSTYAFYLYHFGTGNLVAKDNVSVLYVSWHRTWNQFFDLNQGLLPFAPVLLVGMLWGAVRIVRSGDVRARLLLAGTLAVMVGTQVSRNWNSGGDGLQRYLVWVLPLAAGVAATGLGGGRRLWWLAGAAVVAHFALEEAYRRTDALQGYLQHTGPARWVMEHVPQAYMPEAEVFVERTRGVDNYPLTAPDLPVAFARPDGTVSKMVLDHASLDKLAARFEVDPEYLAGLRGRASGFACLFFEHPPRGAVRVRPAPQP
jgi:hypothetical protein